MRTTLYASETFRVILAPFADFITTPDSVLEERLVAMTRATAVTHDSFHLVARTHGYSIRKAPSVTLDKFKIQHLHRRIYSFRQAHPQCQYCS